MSTSCRRKRNLHQTTLTETFGSQKAAGDVGSQDSADSLSCSTSSPTADLTASTREETDFVLDEPTTRGGLPQAFVESSTAVCNDQSARASPVPVRRGEGAGGVVGSRDPSEDASSTGPSWRGVPRHLINFGPSAYPHPSSPLQSSPTHSVLFRPGNPPVPFPDHFKDVWDNHHVKMPCSKMSQYPVDAEGGAKAIVPRWQLICDTLRKPIGDSNQLADAILAYNSRYATRWKFNNLHDYFSIHCGEEETEFFFSSLLPRIIDLALQLPSIVTHAIPLLRKQESYQITMTQRQASCLLANAFLCTFPSRNTTQRGSEYATYPFINFNGLFSNGRKGGVAEPSQINKLACLFHYFHRVTSHHPPQGTLSFERRVLQRPPDWESSMCPLSQLHVDSTGTIEGNGDGMLQVDFANKYLGGGVLGLGCVQEEIRFLICPELIVSMLFTEELDSNECLLMTGAEQYSTYGGYGSSFEWSGSYEDQTIRDSWGRRQVQVVAMDALMFTNPKSQYAPLKMRRDLNKAFCGFQSSSPTSCGRPAAVATGNWGCGAFRGDPSLKALLQLMAASEASRDLVYFTFGNAELRDQIYKTYQLLTEKAITVGKLWTLLSSYHTQIVDKGDRIPLMPFITSLLVHSP